MILLCSIFSAPEAPTAENILPQFGSSAKIAVFTNNELATDEAMILASSSDHAPFTFIFTTLVAPSPSLTIFKANSLHQSEIKLCANSKDGSSISIKLVFSGFVEIRVNASLVEVSPSTVIVLKLCDKATSEISSRAFLLRGKSVAKNRKKEQRRKRR